MKLTRVLGFLVMLIMSWAIQDSYAVLYEWIDENGVKHYSTEGAPPQSDANIKTEIDSDHTASKFATFVGIKAGRFVMGSPPTEEGRDRVRETQQMVTIPKDFYIMSTEVTRKMWERVMGRKYWGANECDNCPATGLLIDRIAYFIRQLNLEEGGDVYRLPTAAEWEYACRAGSALAFHTGSCLSSWQANIKTGFPPYGDCPGEDIRPSRIKAVGSYQANGWGLFDMHGNAAEICTATDNLEKPVYVAKGGSYKNSARNCRSAAIRTFRLDVPVKGIGFRLVKIIP